MGNPGITQQAFHISGWKKGRGISTFSRRPRQVMSSQTRFKCILKACKNSVQAWLLLSLIPLQGNQPLFVTALQHTENYTVVKPYLPFHHFNTLVYYCWARGLLGVLGRVKDNCVSTWKRDKWQSPATGWSGAAVLAPSTQYFLMWSMKMWKLGGMLTEPMTFPYQFKMILSTPY